MKNFIKSLFSRKKAPADLPQNLLILRGMLDKLANYREFTDDESYYLHLMREIYDYLNSDACNSHDFPIHLYRNLELYEINLINYVKEKAPGILGKNSA